MMNQSASATRRPPTGSSFALPGCCPVFPQDTFAGQRAPPPPPLITSLASQRCVLGLCPNHQQAAPAPAQQQQHQQQPPPPPLPQATQQQHQLLQQTATQAAQQAQHQLQPNTNATTTTTTTANHLPPTSTTTAPAPLTAPAAPLANQVQANLAHATGLPSINGPTQPQQQQQQQQPPLQQTQASTRQDPHSSYIHSMAYTALQFLLSRYPAGECMALAAALASATTYHRSQQLQQAHQQPHHQPQPQQQAPQPVPSQPQQQHQHAPTQQQPQQLQQPQPIPALPFSYPYSHQSEQIQLQPPQQQQPQQPPQHHQQPQQQQPQQQQQPAPPQPQQQPPIPPLPFSYPFSHAGEQQALALLTNSQLAHNFFNQAISIYLQGVQAEPHHTHQHHHPSHHYHHHLHGSHHHHHHHIGPNGQNNGQDDTMLTISESKPRGLNRAEIDSLTAYIQQKENDSRTCVICLSKFELKSKIRPLPCNHAFHAKCVDKWLRANRTCPICRRDALKTYGAKIKRI